MERLQESQPKKVSAETAARLDAIDALERLRSAAGELIEELVSAPKYGDFALGRVEAFETQVRREMQVVHAWILELRMPSPEPSPK